MKLEINGKLRTAKDAGDGLYIIRATGEIYSRRSRRIIGKGPRAKVSWYGVDVLASHLVAEAYLAPRKPGQVLHHINGDPSDNRPSNLVWLSPSDHAKAHRKMLAWQRAYLKAHRNIAIQFFE